MLKPENIVKKTIIRKFLLLASLSLVGCSEGVVSSNQTVDFGEADRQIAIQPIQVCDDSGSHCARVNLFEDITRRILEQAKLKVSFLPINQIRNSRFLTINDGVDGSGESEFYQLSRSGSASEYGRHPDSSRNSGPINVWFVEDIETNEGFTQFGLAWVNANGVLISEAAIDFDGTGRPDTLAHEIGHNLGLRHGALGAGESNNLLTDGGRRNIPSSIEDIGSVSQLTDAQIAEIKRSGFLTNVVGVDSGEEISLDSEATLVGVQAGAWADTEMAVQMLAKSDRQSLVTAAASVNPISTRALIAADSSREASRSVPEPASWAALPLFAILLAAYKRSAAKPCCHEQILLVTGIAHCCCAFRRSGKAIAWKYS